MNLLREYIRTILEANEYGWKVSSKKNMLLDKEGMTQSDKDNQEAYLKSMSLMEGLLTEVAMGPDDLTDDMRVVIQASGNSFKVRLVGRNPERGDDEYLLGDVVAERDTGEYPCSNAFIVSWSKVQQSGWGPMLYDLAMEYATSQGSGLMADRTTVSRSAFNVWQYYADQRGDVEKVQLDDDDDNLTPGNAADNCAQYLVYKGAHTGERWEGFDLNDEPWDPRGKEVLLNDPLSKMYRSNGTPTMDQLNALDKLEMK